MNDFVLFYVQMTWQFLLQILFNSNGWCLLKIWFLWHNFSKTQNWTFQWNHTLINDHWFLSSTYTTITIAWVNIVKWFLTWHKSWWMFNLWFEMINYVRSVSKVWLIFWLLHCKEFNRNDSFNSASCSLILSPSKK